MRELKQQLVSALLVIFTVAAVIAAAVNFQQQSRYHLPDDGVTWDDRASGDANQVVAVYVTPGSPGEKAGIHAGDLLVSIEGVKIERAIEATEVLARLGAWRKAEYQILHGGVRGSRQRDHRRGRARFDCCFITTPSARCIWPSGCSCISGARNAPRALHFFLLCLASFIMSTFHYTGKLNNFDKVIYLGNVIAGYLAPDAVPAFLLRFSGAAKMDSPARRGGAGVSAGPGAAGASISGFSSDGCDRRRRCSRCAGCWIASGWASCARCTWPAARCSRSSCGMPRIPSCAAS